jgi:predicted nucleic acid-binding protein
MENYADIDAFSQSNHPTMRLSGSARKMGKNDLWIAATTFLLQGKLFTTDGDFFHLHNTFFAVEYIDPELYRNI